MNNYPVNGMAKASLILGIFSMLTCFCIYTSIICAPLGIILGLLSRGVERTLNPTAKMGIILCIGSYLAIAFILISSILRIIEEYGSFSNFIQIYFNYLNEMYPINN